MAGTNIDYLRNIIIRDGNSPGQKIIEYQYNGEKVSGFFSENSIKEGRLEVKVIGLATTENWAFVKPVRGYFLNHNNGILARLSDLD